MRRLICGLALATACAQTRPAPMTSAQNNWPALDAQLLADAAATYNFKLGHPAALAVTPDGAVLFRRTGPRSFAADLYELDTKTGKVRTLFAVGGNDEQLSDPEKARRERTRTATKGVVDIGVSTDGRIVMVPQGEVAHLIDRTTGGKTTIQLGANYDPKLSPDGKRIAHTLAFIEALYLAGKRAEVITLSSTHMVPDPKLNLAREQTQIDFFRRNL